MPVRADDGGAQSRSVRAVSHIDPPADPSPEPATPPPARRSDAPGLSGDDAPTGFVERLDRFQRRHPVLGFPIGVVYKFVDDQGVYLAVLITYYGFLSLFPLLLLLASITGFLLQNNDDLREVILDSTISQFDIVRTQIIGVDDGAGGVDEGLQGSTAAIIAGAVIAIYGALGVAQAVQNAMNAAWAVPRNRRPNPIKARLNSLLLILTAGLTIIGATVLSGLFSSSEAEGVFGWLAVLGAVVLNTAVAIVGFRVATARRLRKRDVLPGALVAAAWWQALQLFGTAYFNAVAEGADATYGTFSVVFGLLAWLLLAALGLVMGVELNVVLAKRLYPRALMTVFTDNVDLTEADKQAYADLARAQRLKGFQTVTVSYEDDGQLRSARRQLPEDVF